MNSRIEQDVHITTLASGATAVVKQKSNIPLVSIAIAARGGSHKESESNAGLSGLTARTSIKGTNTRTARQIAEIAENMGGSVSPSVSTDLIDWDITVPARHFEPAIELLADVVFDAAFPEHEFAVEQKLMLADLQQTRDDMYRYPLRLCLQQAFRGHPYGNTISAAEIAMARATPEQLRGWHNEQMRAAPWAFVVGDVDPDFATAVIERVLPKRLEKDGDHGRRAEWPGPGADSDTRDKAQTALALAFPGPGRNDPDVHALQVLANAVSGLGGRFFEELRSKRSLAYTVSLMPVSRWLGGAFVAYIATSPEREEEARAALLEEFARLVDEPLPLEEVERAQRYMIGTWQIRSQTNGAQLGDLMQAYMLGPGASEITDFAEHIRAVTPESIQAVAQRYFHTSQLCEGVVRGTGGAR